jgi:hypothetical protein
VNTLADLTAALERLGIPYLIGGSVASSAHGIPRTTLDVDIVARIALRQTVELAAALGSEWYVDTEGARTGISVGRSFNVIHMLSGAKFDIFPATEDFKERQLERAVRRTVEIWGGRAECPVATAEDILLAKLRWYRDGGEVSEVQWNDIQGILAVNPSLDFGYVEQWAARLGVGDLLARAQSDVRRDAE